jgi:hypothetical protein
LNFCFMSSFFNERSIDLANLQYSITNKLRAFVTVRSSSSSKRDLEIEIEHCLKRHPLPSVLF